MIELREEEIEQVSGGQVFYAAIGLAGAYYAGQAFGSSLYQTYTSVMGESLGETIYYATN